MASILERALQRFADRPTMNVNVPEWGVDGKSDFLVYFQAPSLMVISQARRDAKGDDLAQMAGIVTRCAMNEKGEKLFSPLDYKQLMLTDPGSVSRVASAIMSASSLSVADAEKN